MRSPRSGRPTSTRSHSRALTERFPPSTRCWTRPKTICARCPMRSPTSISATQSCASIEPSAVNFSVVHTTEDNYTERVAVSHHVARLSPRPLPRQDCVEHELQIEPAPAARATHVDYFGNTMTFFAMQGAHNRLTVRARSTVAVRATARPDPFDTPPWDAPHDPSAVPLDAI